MKETNNFLVLFIAVVSMQDVIASDVGLRQVLDPAKWWGEFLLMVISIVGLVAWFCRDNLKRAWFKVYDYFHRYTIEEWKIKNIDTSEIMAACRSFVPLVVVDDDDTARGGMVMYLTNTLNFRNVSPLHPVRLDDVFFASKLIAVVDIKGLTFVGSGVDGDSAAPSKYEGLGVASCIKKRYPWMKIVSYSSAIEEYEGNHILEDVVDGKFSKNASTGEKMDVMNDCLKQVVDPAEFWNDMRRDFIKAQVSTRDILAKEHEYVKALIHINKLTMQDLTKAMRVIKDKNGVAEKTADLLDALAKLCK